MFRWLTERRRRHILETPWPAAWTQILERNVAAYAALDDDQRTRLQQLVQVFVAEKHWEGCGGLELTDEIRVTIAGQGCLLILGRDHDLFARLVSILVYPSTVELPAERVPVWRTSRPLEPSQMVAGVANRDVVVLVWDDVVRGTRDPRDGRNVVLHELAHTIDFADGASDGAPPLDSRADAREWAEVCRAAYDSLVDAVDRDKPTGVLRAYGATNPAEFFAVATEAFFERAPRLAAEHPDLYRILARFYNLDLATRSQAH